MTCSSNLNDNNQNTQNGKNHNRCDDELYLKISNKKMTKITKETSNQTDNHIPKNSGEADLREKNKIFLDEYSMVSKGIKLSTLHHIFHFHTTFTL